jgi:hypothetical protein
MDVRTIQFHGSGAWGVQATQDMHQGGLSASRWADNGGEISLIYIKVHPIQGMNDFTPQMVCFANITQFDQGHERD